MTYAPTPVIQGDGSPLAWLNCTCASGATALDRDTRGRDRTTGGKVRALTGDTIGGTNLDQVDAALRSGWPPQDHLDSRRMMAFDDAVDEVASGRGAVVQIGYDGGFAGTKLDGSPGFTGNHAIYWNAVRVARGPDGVLDYERSRAQVHDPLWDGRRPGIPSPLLRWIPLSTLRRACGRLELSNGVRVGTGRGYFGFTRDTEPDAPKPDPIIPIQYGANTMIVAGGLTLHSSHVMALKAGQVLRREPTTTSPVVTRMAKTGEVAYIGNAAPGWRAVLVQTGNFPDGQKRPVVLFVPASAGVVAAR